MSARLASAVLLCVALGLGLGCTRKPGWPPAPAKLHLGEDACASCRMIISDARFGAQLHQRGAAPQQFDDLGCLLDVVPRQAGPIDPVGVFVRSYPDGAWLRGDHAQVVHIPGLDAPMGSGLAAFATPEEAAAEVARHPGATSQSLVDLLSKPRARADRRGLP